MDAVNVDTGTALAFVSEGSMLRRQLKAHVHGKSLLMTATAVYEFQHIIATFAGPLEQARALRFLGKVTSVLDAPSARAVALRPTKNLEPNDIIIFGTGDQLGIETMTTDRRAVSAALHQGVRFQVYIHPACPLKGC